MCVVLFHFFLELELGTSPLCMKTSKYAAWTLCFCTSPKGKGYVRCCLPASTIHVPLRARPHQQDLVDTGYAGDLTLHIKSYHPTVTIVIIFK